LAYVAYQKLGRRRDASGAPQWSPLPADEPRRAPAPAKWVAPVDGQVPDGYPIKANESSRIFHVPGGRFYTRTTAHRCYANADDAIADGYRQAKA
jgi:hypothetical protein